MTIEIAAPSSQTVRIIPDNPWLPGEQVTVSILTGIVPVEEAPFAGVAFTFRVETAAESLELREGNHWIAPGSVEEMRAGDLDGDSHVDLVYYVEDGSAVEALRGLGEGKFEFRSRTDVKQRITCLALADMDGDDDLDLIIGSSDRAYIYFINDSVGCTEPNLELRSVLERRVCP